MRPYGVTHVGIGRILVPQTVERIRKNARFLLEALLRSRCDNLIRCEHRPTLSTFINRDGLLYLDEYVGPSRFEWTDELLEEQRRVYSALPAHRRRVELLPFPIQQDDPSEAFRSSEIEPQLAVGFDVVARRPYGGTLLSVIFPALLPSEVDRELIERMIEEERGMLARGAPPYYAIIVARPKRGLSLIRASAHYWLVPKMKRLGRELQRVAATIRP